MSQTHRRAWFLLRSAKSPGTDTSKQKPILFIPADGNRCSIRNVIFGGNKSSGDENTENEDSGVLDCNGVSLPVYLLTFRGIFLPPNSRSVRSLV